jgi:hypothetical protein
MTGNELENYLKARLEDALDKGGFPSDPQPNPWWCPHCGYTQNAPVADQPDPEPGRELFDDHLAGPCPYWTPIGSDGMESCALVLGHTGNHVWESEVDDSYGPGPRFTERATELGVPVGDDTPAPTVEEWSDAVRDHLAVHSGYAADSDDPTLNHLDDLMAAYEDSRVPPGDDTTCGYCGATFDQHDLSAMRDCNRLLRAALDSALTDDPVGGDTPAPTAQWTVEPVTTPYATVSAVFRDGERVPLAEVVDALNRAGAAPDLTALRAAHQAYLAEMDPTRWVARQANVFAAVAALVREDTTDG